MNYISTNANLSFSDSKFLEAVGLLEEVFSFKYDNNNYKMEGKDPSEIVEVNDNCIKLNICFKVEKQCLSQNMPLFIKPKRN